MNKIMLNDILNLSEQDSSRCKIRFNQTNQSGYDPLSYYMENPEIVNTEWLFARNKVRFFNVGEIAISLLKLSYDTWLLTTIKLVTKEFNVSGINYDGIELDNQKAYFGRVVVKYHKKHQSQVRYYERIKDQLEVVEILPSLYDGSGFPGYDNVRLSYRDLKIILDRNKSDWINALESQKAVYLIIDKSTGEQYVGSATSNLGMLLSRWKTYIHNGHGGNKKLNDIVSEKGIGYIEENFIYSILENYNQRVDDDYILKRESWWKNTLGSRAFGLNLN